MLIGEHGQRPDAATTQVLVLHRQLDLLTPLDLSNLLDLLTQVDLLQLRYLITILGMFKTFWTFQHD